MTSEAVSAFHASQTACICTYIIDMMESEQGREIERGDWGREGGTHTDRVLAQVRLDFIEGIQLSGMHVPSASFLFSMNGDGLCFAR